jgi:hypothetical protein
VTGCGCALLIAIIVGILGFFIFGSTDPGEPIEQTTALLVFALVLARVSRVPLGRALVRAGGAKD